MLQDEAWRCEACGAYRAGHIVDPWRRDDRCRRCKRGRVKDSTRLHLGFCVLSPFLPYILSCVVYSTLFFSLIFFPFCQPIEIRRSRQLENPFPQSSSSSSFSSISKKKLFCFITIGSTFFVLLKDFAAAQCTRIAWIDPSATYV